MGLAGGQSGVDFGVAHRLLGLSRGRSWRLLAPRGWFGELFALLRKALTENRDKLVFCRPLVKVFSWFWGPKIVPKSTNIAPRSFLGTELAAKVCQKWLGKPLETRNAI